MTEEILNKKVSETINALTLKLKRIASTEEELLLLMYKYENIYQIVLSEFCNEKKARLLIREIKEIKKIPSYKHDNRPKHKKNKFITSKKMK